MYSQIVQAITEEQPKQDILVNLKKLGYTDDQKINYSHFIIMTHSKKVFLDGQNVLYLFEHLKQDRKKQDQKNYLVFSDFVYTFGKQMHKDKEWVKGLK